MKRFLLALACLAFGFEAYAANPSFSSFATNQFITNNFLIRSRLNSFQFDTNASTVTITNLGSLAGTNNFNTIVVSNLYTTNLFFSTNIVTYVTNLYVTNIVVDNITIITNGTIAGTNIASMADLVWTNELGNIRPTGLQNTVTATNIIGNERLTAAGSFMLEALIGYNLDAGLNDISALTNSVIWITGFDSDPANSSLRLNMGNGQGHILIIQNYTDNSGFTMRNGESLFSSPPGAVQILKGDWVTSTKGDALLLYNNGLNWTELGRMPGSTNNIGSSFWESVAGVLRPLGFSSNTNKFTIAESTGWSGTGTNAFMDDGTFAGVAMINPTDGYMPYRDSAYAFEDSPLYRVDASTVAVQHAGTNSIELIGGNIGTLQFHGPVGSPSIIKSDTEIYYDLEGLGTRFRMGNLLFTPLTTSQASLGTAVFPWQYTYTDSVGWGGHPASYDSGAGVDPEGVVTADPGSIWRNTTSGTVWRKSTGVGNTGWVQFASGSSATINPTDNYIPFRTNSTTFLNSPLYVTGTNVATDGQVIFGPGTTNVMYRSGSFLVVTNGSSVPDGGLKVIGGDGSTALLQSSGNTTYLRGNAAVGLVDSLTGGNGVTWLGNELLPINTGALGQDSTATGSALQWKFVSSKTNFVNGFTSAITTNYSRLAMSHTGTNGVVVFDSQANGTAGSPRNHVFRLGATNQFSIGDGWVQLMRGMTKAEKSTITPTNGMIVYQTDNTPGFRGYVNGSWVIFSTSADP